MKYIPGSSKYVEFLPFWVGVFSSKKAQVLYTKGRSSYYSLKKINNNNKKKTPSYYSLKGRKRVKVKSSE